MTSGHLKTTYICNDKNKIIYLLILLKVKRDLHLAFDIYKVNLFDVLLSSELNVFKMLDDFKN